MDRRRRYYLASELNQFLYCPEQWRLHRLVKEGKLHIREKDRQTRQRRFSKGNQVHATYYRNQQVELYLGRFIKIAVLLLIIGVMLFFLLWKVM